MLCWSHEKFYDMKEESEKMLVSHWESGHWLQPPLLSPLSYYNQTTISTFTILYILHEWYWMLQLCTRQPLHMWPWVQFPVTTSIFRRSSFSLLKYSSLVNWLTRSFSRYWLNNDHHISIKLHKDIRIRQVEMDDEKQNEVNREGEREGAVVGMRFQREPRGEKTQIEIDWETQKKRKGRQMKEGKWEIVIEEWYLFSTIQFLSVSWKICWIGVLHWVKRSWKKTPGVFQSIAWYNWDWTNQNWYRYCQR